MGQLESLPYEILSRVETHLERICRDHDPMRIGQPVDGVLTRRRYLIEPVYVVAWITWVEPILRLLTVVEIVFPDVQTVPRQRFPTLPSTERIMDPLGRPLVPAGI